jgi:acyl dehydratase
MSETQVPEGAHESLGQVTAGPVVAEITAKEAQRYAQAVDDLNPVYFDEEAARAAGHRGLIAPPTLLDHVVVQGWALETLRPDGLFGNPSDEGLNRSRVMFGGQEWDWLAPVHVGDTITAVQRLVAVEEKLGRQGAFVLTTWETTFTDQGGDVVARSRLQGISR